MESSEKEVSETDEHPEDPGTVLDAIGKCTYPTPEQLKKETGLTTRRLHAALRHLEKSNLVRGRKDEIFGLIYRLTLEHETPAEEPKAVKKKAEGKAPDEENEIVHSIKDAYVAGKKYREIAKELKVPEHKVAYVASKLIRLGVVERRIGRKKDPAAKIEIEEDEEDDPKDEPVVERKSYPDVVQLTRGLEAFSKQAEKLGWKVEVEVRLGFPKQPISGVAK